jgi:hypothetical protein
MGGLGQSEGLGLGETGQRLDRSPSRPRLCELDRRVLRGRYFANSFTFATIFSSTLSAQRDGSP